MAPAIPPDLPPSVEEAYRRKCIQLKKRTTEVEDSNEAARLRLSRLKRQVEKLRVERAMLLEQLARRAGANAEDSEGSASPPPSPKEKPLRPKRGHRADATGPGASFLSAHSRALSPGSDVTFSQSFEAGPGRAQGRAANGSARATGRGSRRGGPRKPVNPFELYCNDTRPTLIANNKANGNSGGGGVEEELARSWKDLPEAQKNEYQTKYDGLLEKYRSDKVSYAGGAKSEISRLRGESKMADDYSQGDDAATPAPDDDIEMGNDDTEQDIAGTAQGDD